MLAEHHINESFRRDGFVIVRGLLPAGDLDGIKSDLQELTKRVAEVRNLEVDRANSDFEVAVAELERKDSGFAAALHREMLLTASVAAIWRHPTVLKIVHELTGWDTIAAHPIFNIRPKAPSGKELNYGMHQDPAFWGQSAASIGVVACWLPLVPVSRENGTLQLIRSSHDHGQLFQHYLAPDGSYAPFISEEDQPAGERVVAELNVGDAVFFHQLTVHGGCGPNLSNTVRWAVDLRWQHHKDINFFSGLRDSVKLWDVEEGCLDVDVVHWASKWKCQENSRKALKAWEHDWPRVQNDANVDKCKL